MDRLKQVSEGQGDILASYSYNPSGGLCRLQYGNGIQTEYGYNDSGTLSSLVTVTKQGQVLLNFDYAYDGNGNCIQKSGAPYQNTYAYDRMNRLLEAVQDGKTEKYTYDLAGNRLKKESGRKTEIYEYNAKNQLTGIQSEEKTIQYRYDLQGNLLEELGRTWKKRYAYDAANHQKDIELTRMSDGRAEYFHQSNCYDAEGLRYETKEDGKVIRFLFDRGELAEEIREDAHIRYTRGYDPLSLTWNGAEKSYFVPAEMGSTLFLLDKDHEIQKTYRYDAFGAILNESGDTFNRLTYTGQMYDGAMGQYYLRARFYNPSIGRFMQEDIYRGNGLNLYAYCANNPVIYYDPSGYVWLCDLGKTVPEYLTRQERDQMIEFPGAVVPPTVVTPDNPFGIYTIRATGSYADDKAMLAQLLGIEYYDFSKWRSHHIEYNFDTNEMRMQFVDPLYHKHHHFGGAGQFEKITGFKYGSDEAIKYCKKINTAYELQLLKYPKIK